MRQSAHAMKAAAPLHSPGPPFLQSVLDALSAHVAVIDPSGAIIAINEAWRRFAQSNGMVWDQWGLGSNYLETCERATGPCSDEAPDIARAIRAILAGEQRTFHMEYPCHSPEEERWFQVRLTTLYDSTGLKIVAAHESVTELKRAHEEVRVSEQRFRAVFEGAQDLMLIKDRNLVYRRVNPAVEKLLGMDAAGIVGKQAKDLFGKEEAEHIDAVDRRALQGETIEEEHTRRINGVPMTFLDTRVPLRSPDGETKGICVISRNITDWRRITATPDPAVLKYPSPIMQATLKRAQRAAQTDSIILLLGESGSGKDHLAQWIHKHSHRADGPFFSVNCAAISKELAESELFGHEAGAFTGARTRKKGLLELAEGGTLLLNEIGELPVTLQAKLLTFLDTKTFLRVGGHEKVYVSARLIAATHRDLELEVTEGRFLEPLLHRINVLALRVPSLRERPEDIPLIARNVLQRLSADMQLSNGPVLDVTAMQALRTYQWPGNVRELRNVLERSLILSDKDVLRIDLPAQRNGYHGTNALGIHVGEDTTLPAALDQVTRVLLQDALNQCNGNARRAAKKLGISRDTIYRHFRRLGIKRS